MFLFKLIISQFDLKTTRQIIYLVSFKARDLMKTKAYLIPESFRQLIDCN